MLTTTRRNKFHFICNFELRLSVCLSESCLCCVTCILLVYEVGARDMKPSSSTTCMNANNNIGQSPTIQHFQSPWGYNSQDVSQVGPSTSIADGLRWPQITAQNDQMNAPYNVCAVLLCCIYSSQKPFSRTFTPPLTQTASLRNILP
jgi:hypothetical protein